MMRIYCLAYITTCFIYVRALHPFYLTDKMVRSNTTVENSQVVVLLNEFEDAWVIIIEYRESALLVAYQETFFLVSRKVRFCALISNNSMW